MKNLFSATGLFSSFDLHFANFICKLSGTESQNLFLSAALTTRMLREGHICCDLTGLSQMQFQTSSDEQISLPETTTLLDELRKYPVIGKPGEYYPLILDDTRLYLYRYWKYEHDLAQSILSRAKNKNEISINKCTEKIETLFNNKTDNEIDWQKIAATVSMLNNFTVISGGPGTGKTTTVAKIIALLALTSPKMPRIALAAPTGKAANRLKLSINSILPFLTADSDILSKLPLVTQTVHRLLVTIPNSQFFRHNASSPLPYDIIIVDEASMIDLALMYKLISAVPPKSHLIMLGDRDQLSSVEAGAVLGDICDTGNNHLFTAKQTEILKSIIPGYNQPDDENEPPISDCIISLRKSYRFNDSSGIAKLSHAVNGGDYSSVKNILTSSTYTDCTLKKLPLPANLASLLHSKVMEHYFPLLSEKDPEEALKRLDTFKILCAIRQSPFGVDSINNAVISILKSNRKTLSDDIYYRGLPLMVNRNDYTIDLYNGDTGIVLPDTDNQNQLRIAFKSTDNTIRMIQTSQVRSCEIAYALTVHKSQGSEYDHILIILPPVPVPVLTRELLYTALTRAKKSVEIWCTDSVMEKTVTSKISRQSGLRAKLWQNSNPIIATDRLL